MQSLVSVRLLLFVASLIVFGVSIFLIQWNSHSRRGGDDYVRRNKLKTFGYILLFPGVLLFALAALNDQMAIDSRVSSFDPVAAAAAQAYVPPVLPKPTQYLLAPPPNNTWKTQMPGTNAGAYASAPPRLSPMPTTGLPSTALPTSAPAALAPAAVPSSTPALAPPDPTHPLSKEQQLDADILATTEKIAANPKDAQAYADRGNLYAAKRAWEAAARDYQSALAIDATNTKAKFNLAEMSFMQKKFEDAKTGFVALEQDSDLGDLAAYKAFLCDLFGGEMDTASKELDAFNQVGSNASYYFANAAWSINHRKLDDARDWLKSATRIYPPEKFRLYATTLFEMGYLPLPVAPASN